MRAEIVSVGTEILFGQIADTNAQELGKAFAKYGIDHTHRQTVGDNLDRLAEALRLALSRADIVVTIGGLGPTEDDLTRDGIAAALGLGMETDKAVAKRLKAMFVARGLPWVDSQYRQAQKPIGAEIIPNPHGTAPGIVCRVGTKTVIAMPGPRTEFVPMLDGPVGNVLKELGGGWIIASRTLKVVGIGESIVEDRIRDLMQGSSPSVAPYAKLGEVHLRVSAKAQSAADALVVIDPAAEEIRKRLHPHVFGQEDDTIESVLLQMLRERHLSLSVAESCTGGALAARLTDVPGSSDVFVGGAITYSNELKVSLVGVSKALIEQHGAVSEAVASQMAEGACSRFQTDAAIAITGIAGPTGGTPDKPVGLVYIATALAGNIHVTENCFIGHREAIRRRATQWGLVQMRSMLIDQP